MIHIIKHYPVDVNALNRTRCGDTILFLENAVLALNKQDQCISTLMQRLLLHINLCVRKGDMLAQGLTRQELFNHVAVLDELDINALEHQDSAVKSWN